MNTLELLKVKNRTIFFEKNYTPEQIAAKFGEVEAEIKSELPDLADRTHSNVNLLLQNLTYKQFKAIVEFTFDRLLLLFTGLGDVEGFVKYFLDCEVKFLIKKSLPKEEDAMRVLHDTKKKLVQISVARKFLHVHNDTYIAFVSGIQTKSLLKAFIVNAAHELVHVLLLAFGREEIGHGKEFAEMSKSLFGMTEVRFEAKHVVDVETGKHGNFDKSLKMYNLPIKLEKEKAPKKSAKKKDDSDEDEVVEISQKEFKKQNEKPVPRASLSLSPPRIALSGSNISMGSLPFGSLSPPEIVRNDSNSSMGSLRLSLSPPLRFSQEPLPLSPEPPPLFAQLSQEPSQLFSPEPPRQFSRSPSFKFSLSPQSHISQSLFSQLSEEPVSMLPKSKPKKSAQSVLDAFWAKFPT